MRVWHSMRRSPVLQHALLPNRLMFVFYVCLPQGVKVTITDGAAHAVDSSELAFKLASMFAFK